MESDQLWVTIRPHLRLPVGRQPPPSEILMATKDDALAAVWQARCQPGLVESDRGSWLAGCFASWKQPGRKTTTELASGPLESSARRNQTPTSDFRFIHLSPLVWKPNSLAVAEDLSGRAGRWHTNSQHRNTRHKQAHSGIIR